MNVIDRQISIANEKGNLMAKQMLKLVNPSFKIINKKKNPLILISIS